MFGQLERPAKYTVVLKNILKSKYLFSWI